MMFRRALPRCSSSSLGGTATARQAGPCRKAAAAAAAAPERQRLSSGRRAPATRSVAHLRETVAQQFAGLVPEHDRRVIMERWAAMEDPTALQLKEAEAHVKAIEDQLEEMAAVRDEAVKEAEALKGWVKEQAGIKAEEAVHPLFGHLIKDLGYKKVYCASVRQLKQVPIWEMQRILRKDRAEAIATEKRKKGFPVKVPGILTLYTLPDGSYRLLDGQHRLEALRILASSGILNGDSNYVLVEVFPLEKEAEAKALFLEINSAQPVKLIDLPDEARPDIKGLINGATERMLQAFPEMFKVSQNCKIPHLNIDNLRDDLYQYNVVGRHSLKTADELYDWLIKENDALGNKSEKDWKRLYKGASNMTTVEKAMAKARKEKLFLGLDRTWLSR